MHAAPSPAFSFLHSSDLRFEVRGSAYRRDAVSALVTAEAVIQFLNARRRVISHWWLNAGVQNYANSKAAEPAMSCSSSSMFLQFQPVLSGSGFHINCSLYVVVASLKIVDEPGNAVLPFLMLAFTAQTSLPVVAACQTSQKCKGFLFHAL